MNKSSLISIILKNIRYFTIFKSYYKGGIVSRIVLHCEGIVFQTRKAIDGQRMKGADETPFSEAQLPV